MTTVFDFVCLLVFISRSHYITRYQYLWRRFSSPYKPIERYLDSVKMKCYVSSWDWARGWILWMAPTVTFNVYRDKCGERWTRTRARASLLLTLLMSKFFRQNASQKPKSTFFGDIKWLVDFTGTFYELNESFSCLSTIANMDMRKKTTDSTTWRNACKAKE